MVAIAVSEYLGSAPTEEDILVEGLLRKDPKAWNTFLQQYKVFILGIARRMLRDEEKSQDVLQEVCLAVSRDIDKFQQRSGLRTWVYKITQNAVLHLIRDNKTPELIPFDDQDVEGSNGVRVHERARIITAVREGIGRLPEIEKNVLDLELDGYSDREIADQLGFTVCTIKIRIHRAKKKLRERFLGLNCFY